VFTPEIINLINKNTDLFWYIPTKEKQKVSKELLVETILNYGDKYSVIELLKLMGINNVAQIFRKAIRKGSRTKGNYQELTINYFTLVFKKYAN